MAPGGPGPTPPSRGYKHCRALQATVGEPPPSATLPDPTRTPVRLGCKGTTAPQAWASALGVQGSAGEHGRIPFCTSQFSRPAPRTPDHHPGTAGPGQEAGDAVPGHTTQRMSCEPRAPSWTGRETPCSLRNSSQTDKTPRASSCCDLLRVFSFSLSSRESVAGRKDNVESTQRQRGSWRC